MFRSIPNLSMLLRGFLTMVVYWLTIAVGLMIVLAALGVNITPLFALVGGATFIIAFAMQDTLGNLAAGLMIMINRPFDEGDYVAVAGVGGTVRKVSIVSTQVTTPDNQVIVIPNSKVWGDVITNVTASNTRRVDMVFRIAYEDSIETAQKVLENVVTAHPKVLSNPAPLIRVNQLAESSVSFIVRAVGASRGLLERLLGSDAAGQGGVRHAWADHAGSHRPKCGSRAGPTITSLSRHRGNLMPAHGKHQKAVSIRCCPKQAEAFWRPVHCWLHDTQPLRSGEGR